MNELLRQHQGRPRGAARHRQDLPDERISSMTGQARRLAAHGVPDAGRTAADLHGHVFSEGPPLRHAGVSRGAHRGRQATTASKRDEIRERGASLVDALGNDRGQQRGRLREAVARTARRKHASGSEQSYDARPRRLRRRAEVSASDQRSSCCSPHWHAAAVTARSRTTHALTMVTHTLDCMALSAACTTSSAAASSATASIGFGRFRTSRRCSTTTRSCSPSTPTRTRRPAHRTMRRVASAHGRLGHPRHAGPARRRTTRRSMPIPSTRKASSTSGRPQSSTRCSTRTRAQLAKRVLRARRAPRTSKASTGICIIAEAPDDAAAALDIDAPRRRSCSKRRARKLLAAREQRVWPGRDEKMLVSWNGLMIAALARAARVLDRPELAQSATRAVDFIRAELWQRRPPESHVQGRPRALRRLSRRLRVPRVRPHRAVAVPLARQRSRVRAASSPTCCSTHFEDAARRLLLHGRRPRAPHPQAEARSPTRRCRPATASPPWRCSRSATCSASSATSTRRSAPCAPRCTRMERYPEGARDAAARARRAADAAEARGAARHAGRSSRLAAQARRGSYEPHRLAFAIPNDAALPGLLAQRAPHAGTPSRTSAKG